MYSRDCVLLFSRFPLFNEPVLPLWNFSANIEFVYEDDFGDSWEHEILVEKILPAEAEMAYPHCLKGKRACPPEDVGGVWGYEAFLEAIRDPAHEEYDS